MTSSGGSRAERSRPTARSRRWPAAPRNARFVGFALHANPEPGVIPCHRVVFRDGSLAPGFAFGGPERQRAMLEEEGVPFIPPRAGHDNAGDGGWRVDLARCQWQA